LVAVLRRALIRAGIVTGYQHVCRKKGRTHAELAVRNARSRPQILAQSAGEADPVPRLAAHDPKPADDGGREPSRRAACAPPQKPADHRISTEIYGHSPPSTSKGEIDRLPFGFSVAEPVSQQNVATQPLL
jgi:hypothetical protein